MAYVFLDGHKTELDNTSYEMEFYLNEVWITLAGKQVQVVNLWNDTSTTINLSPYISGESVHITKSLNKIYVFDCYEPELPYEGFIVTGFVVIDASSKQVLETVQLPIEAHCNPVFSNNKLWFSTIATESSPPSDIQYMFNLDITAGWSDLVPITGNKQFVQRRFISGNNEFVYVDSFNESGVIQYDAITGLKVKAITINRKPDSFNVNNDRELLVGSFLGMVSVINQDA